MRTWLVAMAGLALAGTATAQQLTPAPSAIPGSISDTDPRDSQGRRYDEVVIELVRGQRILITAAPSAGSRLQPAIELFEPGGASPLSTSGASGAPSSARLAFTAPRDGAFAVRVVAAGLAAGAYTLSIGANTASRPSRGFSSGAIGGSLGSVATPRPSPPDAGQVAPSEGTLPTVGGGPRSRFIICPGHPRCPRR